MIQRLIGLILFCGGFYFVGQNIIFAGPFFSFQGIAAAGSVVAIVSGLFMFFFGGQQFRIPAVLAVMVGIVLVLTSGRIYFTPISLGQVFIGLALMTAGYRLATNGAIDI
jgi:hypothetical protein